MASISAESNDSQIVGQIIDNGRVSATQVLVIALAIVLNMLDGFDVTAMAFTVHPIGQELQISPDMLGIVFSAALAGMMIGALFVAPLSDDFGRRLLILICTGIIGVTTVLTGLSSALWELLILRFITGVAVGGLLASLAAIAAEYSSEKYRSLAVVCVTAGYPLGATLGGFIAAALIPEYGWRSVFFAGGSLTIAMVFLLYFKLPESLQFLLTKQPANALTRVNSILLRMKKRELSSLPKLSDKKADEKASVSSLLSSSRSRLTLTLWASFFFCFIVLYFLMSWIPKLVVNAGLSEVEGVFASVAFNGGGVMGIVLLGFMASKFSLSRLIGFSLMAATGFMVLFALASGLHNLIVYLLAIGLLLQGGFTGLYAVAAKVYPTEIRATGVGWAIGLGRFGAVVGPYVGGILIDMNVSMEFNFMLFAVPLLISGLLALKLNAH